MAPKKKANLDSETTNNDVKPLAISERLQLKRLLSGGDSSEVTEEITPRKSTRKKVVSEPNKSASNDTVSVKQKSGSRGRKASTDRKNRISDSEEEKDNGTPSSEDQEESAPLTKKKRPTRGKSRNSPIRRRSTRNKSVNENAEESGSDSSDDGTVEKEEPLPPAKVKSTRQPIRSSRSARKEAVVEELIHSEVESEAEIPTKKLIKDKSKRSNSKKNKVVEDTNSEAEVAPELPPAAQKPLSENSQKENAVSKSPPNPSPSHPAVLDSKVPQNSSHKRQEDLTQLSVRPDDKLSSIRGWEPIPVSSFIPGKMLPPSSAPPPSNAPPALNPFAGSKSSASKPPLVGSSSCKLWMDDLASIMNKSKVKYVQLLTIECSK